MSSSGTPPRGSRFRCLVAPPTRARPRRASRDRSPDQGALLLLAALVIHTSVLSGIRLQGVRPDLMLLIAVCAGLVAGPERGAIVGFAAGLASDLFLQTPLGLSALTFTVVAFW